MKYYVGTYILEIIDAVFAKQTFYLFNASKQVLQVNKSIRYSYDSGASIVAYWFGFWIFLFMTMDFEFIYPH